MKGTVFIATSLDGYIARPDGSVDFLDDPSYNEDHGFGALMASVSAVLMGRNTYDTLEGFAETMDTVGGWPYGDTPLFVLTHRPLQPPAAFPEIEAMEGTPEEIALELDSRGVDRAYVDGGAVIQSFLAAGLIDRLIITTVPVLLGEGIPLFGTTGGDVRLRHVTTASFTNGLVQSTYDVV